MSSIHTCNVGSRFFKAQPIMSSHTVLMGPTAHHDGSASGKGDSGSRPTQTKLDPWRIAFFLSYVDGTPMAPPPTPVCPTCHSLLFCTCRINAVSQEAPAPLPTPPTMLEILSLRLAPAWEPTGETVEPASKRTKKSGPPQLNLPHVLVSWSGC